MAITVKHTKVSTIPDSGDASLIEPSDWNADHQLVGTVPVANGGTGAATLTGYVKGNGTSAMTAASTIPNTDITGLGTASTKDAGSANGVATLDGSGTVPISQLPSAVLGALSYQGTWNASTNTPTLVSSTGTKGYYYVVSVAGSTNLNGITDWQVGDWAVYNGSAWQKIDNTDAVTSVNGYTGTVVLGYNDVGAFPATSTTGSGNVVLATGATLSNPNISNYEAWTLATKPSYTEGLQWYDSSAHCLAYYNDSSNAIVHIGQDIQVKVINNTGSTIANGSPVYITSTSSGQTYPNVALAKADVAATSAVIGLTNGAIANGSIGYVTSQGGIDSVNTGSFTVGQVLYLSPYSAGQLMNTIPPTGITVQVGVVSYVDSSNGKIYVKQTTPLAVPASIVTGTLGVDHGGTGATTLTGYVKGSGTSAMTASSTIPTTDLSGTITNAQLANSAITINGTSTSLGGSISVGTVTSVTGTSPIVSSGGSTPAISMPAATSSVNGYLTSTDWTTFNNKQPAGTYVTSVSATSPVTSTGGTTPTIAMPAATGSVNGYLTSTDWTTFNGKANAFTYTTNYIPYGQGTTTPLQSANHTFDGTNLTLGNAGVSARFQGDFSNATVASRTAFVTGTTNGSTGIYALPNGTSTAASWQATNNATPTNASKILIATNGSTDVQLVSGINGTGTYLPLTFWNNGAEKARLSVAGGFSVGTATDAGSTNILAAGNVTGAQVVASNGFHVNSNTVATSYSIPSGSSAMSAGPMTIASGQTVTVPSGSRWVVL